jgi:hypothetical protein
MSSYLDTQLTVNAVHGEADHTGHMFVMWSIPDTEYANTPPKDLWAFYITQHLNALAEFINKGGDFTTKALAIPPKGSGVISFVSSDGNVPVRMTVSRRIADELGPDRHLFTLDLYAQPIGE